MSRNSVLADMASQDVTAAEFNLLDGVQLLATDAIIGEDAQTKIDFETANEIHFDTNNSEAMVIDTNGNVGIGNANPGDFDGANAQRLVVGDGTGHDGMTIFSSSTDSGTIAFGDSASGAAAYSGRISYAHDTNSMSFHTGSNTFAMTINGSQNVGIGSASPTAQLTVHGSSHNYIHLKSGTGNEAQMSFYDGTTVKWSIGKKTDNTFTIHNQIAAAQVLAISTAGNVGIGSTAPGAVLELVKNSGAAGTTQLTIDNTAIAGGSTDEYVQIKFRHGGATAADIICGKESDFNSNANKDGFLSFWTTNSDSSTEKFRIASNGDLTATDTSIGSNSDKRLKKNITNYIYPIETFKKYETKIFDWKNPEMHGDRTQQIGLIAQEVEVFEPRWIGGYQIEEEHLDYEHIEDTDGVIKTSKLGQTDAMYISVINQLITRIEALENA